MCGFDYLLSLAGAIAAAVIIGSMATEARAADPPDHREYTITHVFSADFCSYCHDLIKRLKADGYRTVTEYKDEPPMVNAFPTVAYVDSKGFAHFDSGEHYYNWQAARPDKTGLIKIIEWRTKQ